MVGKALQSRAVVAFGALVGGGHREDLLAAEHVELGDRERGQPVDPRGVLERDEVEPAGPTRAARGGAELAALLAQLLSGLVVELGGERPGADAGGVGLGHAPDLADVLRPDPGAYAGCSGDRVGGGDERVGAVVDVEQGGLGALEDHRLAGVERVVDQARGVGDVLLQAAAVEQVLLGDRLEVERRVALEFAQLLGLGLERGDDLLLEDLLVEHVLHPDPEPQGLVGVAGADPAPGGADLALAELRLADLVEHQVVGHDQVRVGAEPQVGGVHAALAQPVDLAGEHRRVDHDAVADHAGGVGVEDPGGDQVELEDLVAVDDRVAGVVASLKARDDVRARGEQVDDLALPLVAPLGSDDDGARHPQVSLGAGQASRRSAAGGGSSRRSTASKRRWSRPKSGTISHISSRRETVRSPIWAASSSRSRLVVTTIAFSAS